MTAKRKPKAKSARKRGAQPGNKNNLRHGFYSKSFKADELKRIRASALIDVTDEIELNRIMMGRLQNEISFDEVSYTDDKGNQLRNDHYLRQLNTLAAMTTAQSTLVRTQFLLKGRSGDIQSSILAALEELRLEMGI